MEKKAQTRTRIVGGVGRRPANNSARANRKYRAASKRVKRIKGANSAA